MLPRLLTFLLIAILVVRAQNAEDSRETLIRKFMEEKQRMLHSWNFVKSMTEGLVEKMKETVQVALLKQLSQEVSKTLEAAEDALIAAEAASVRAEACVTTHEDTARLAYSDGVERMRVCVEREAEDGRRLLSDLGEVIDRAAPLLQQLQAQFEDCLQESEDDQLTDGQQLKACVIQEEIAATLKQKEETDSEFEAVMQRVDNKYRSGNRCLADTLAEIKEELASLRRDLSSCANIPITDEL